MAAMTGKNLYIKFGGTVFNTDYRTFSAPRSIDKVDASAGADTYKTYLTTLKDGQIGISAILQAADATTRGTLVPGTGGSLEYGLEGTATGKQKVTYTSVFVESAPVSASYNDLIVVDITWQPNSDLTDGTY